MSKSREPTGLNFTYADYCSWSAKKDREWRAYVARFRKLGVKA